MKRLIIIGGGNSIRPQLQNGLWDKLRKDYTFSLNDVIYFFEPTVPVFVDWYWYRERFDVIDKYSLSIGKHDAKIFATHPEIKVSNVSKNTIFLQPSNNEYHGKDSIQKGIYSGVLCGCFGLTVGIALGFKEIYLLGYDFTEINGKTHFYEKDKLEEQIIGLIKEDDGSLRCGIGKNSQGRYRTGIYNIEPKLFFNAYLSISKEVKIFNVSPDSKISTFPKISYEDFYRKLDEDQIDIDAEMGRRQIRRILTYKLGNKNEKK